MVTRRFGSMVGGALTVAALGVSACGGSGSEPSTPSGAAKSSAAKGTPLKIMVVATVDTPSTSWPDIPAAANAAAKAVNDAGGVQGHPLQVVFCDNKFDPNRAQGCARQAVEEKVIADVGNLDYFGALTLPILAKAGIADVGQFANTAADYQSPNSFPLHTGAAGEFAAIPSMAAKQGAKSLSAVMYDNAAAKVQIAPLQSGSKVAGLQYMKTVLVPQTATDFAPYVQSLKSSGADVVAQVLSAQAAIQLLKAGSQVGLGATWMNPSLLGPKDTAAVSGLADGVVMPAPLPPATAEGFPAIDQFNKEMDAAAESGIAGTDNRRVASINTWLAMHALAKVADQIKGPVTSASVLEQLKRTQDLDLFGLLRWSPGASGPKAFPRVSNPDMYETVVKGSEITLASPTPISVFKAMGLA